MTGWLIYSEKDTQRNQFFIDALQDEFIKYDISLTLIIYEKTDYRKAFCKDTPDFALNRSRFFDISVYLEEMGVRVFNNSLVTKIANDKLESYRFFDGTVPYLPVISDTEYVSGMWDYPIVLKSLSGHGGQEVYLANNLAEETNAKKMLNGRNYLVQQCCDTPGKDVRVYILGNKIVAAVLRTSQNGFKSNYSLGGNVELYPLKDHEIDLINKMLCKLDLDYAGIDFLFHNNQLYFNELEDAVGARMLYEVSEIDIVSEFVLYVVRQI